MKILGWCLPHSDQKSLEFGRYYSVTLGFYYNCSRIEQTLVDVEILYHEAESCLQIIITKSIPPYARKKAMPVQIVIFIDEPRKHVDYPFDAVFDFTDEVPLYNTYIPHMLIH